MLEKLFAQTPLHPLRRRLQQEAYCRFNSAQEVQLAASWGVRIDANTASVDEWLRLPGLSIHQARQLTRLTEQGVSLCCLEDVAAVLNLPVQRLRAWQPMLQFCYYSSEELSLKPAAINANRATVEQLAMIPAIDMSLSRAIVCQRQDGPYQDLADLQQRLGLTAIVATELMHYLKFER